MRTGSEPAVQQLLFGIYHRSNSNNGPWSWPNVDWMSCWTDVWNCSSVKLFSCLCGVLQLSVSCKTSSKTMILACMSANITKNININRCVSEDYLDRWWCSLWLVQMASRIVITRYKVPSPMHAKTSLYVQLWRLGAKCFNDD